MGPSPSPDLSLLCGHSQSRAPKVQEPMGTLWALCPVRGWHLLSPTTCSQGLVRGKTE